MKTFSSLMGCIVLVGISAVTGAAWAAGPASPQPLPLERLIGTWQGRSETFASPLTQPGHSTAVNVCRWTASHRFVACDQTIEPSDQHDLAVYAVADKKNTYFYCEVDTTMQAYCADHFTIKGNTWIYESAFEYKGKPLMTRTWNRFDSATHYTFEAEASHDGGHHWEVMSRGEATRIRG